MSGIVVTTASAADIGDWARMRQALWPHAADDHDDDIAAILRETGLLGLMARVDGIAVGFAEISLRHDYVNGCDTSPVAFLEGIFVVPQLRRRGVAGALIAAAQDWARSRGCTEFASDAELDNVTSHAMHKALGFAETDRVVFFHKRLS